MAMRRNGTLAILAILALIAVFVTGWMRRVSAQNCPPASYTNQVFPWAQGTNVNFSFDPTGSRVGDPSNPSPKFGLTPAMTADFGNGIQAWNSQSVANGTNVTFSWNGLATTFPWTVSAAWPKATVACTASNGQTYTWPLDASCSPQPCTDP